jgi:hypothetical protein
MTIDSQDYVARSLQPTTDWEEVWHLWMAIVPRRSITGRLVRGLVCRRHNGRHWIYKDLFEYNSID